MLLQPCLHVGKNKCWCLLHFLYLWWIGTPALPGIAWSVSYDQYLHHPHLHTFLFPVVCHSPQVLGSPPQIGSCNPPLGPLRLEGGGLYLRARKNKKQIKFRWLQITVKKLGHVLVWRGWNYMFFSPLGAATCSTLSSHWKPVISVKIQSTSFDTFIQRWWAVTANSFYSRKWESAEIKRVQL